MKNILLISLAVFMFFACSKDDEFTTEDRLEGFWLLTDVSGGIGGTGYEVNFDHLQINDDNRYSLMVNDAFIQEGTYELRNEDDQPFIRFIPSMVDTIVFDDYEKTIFISEQGSKLTLSDPCCDLFVYYFEIEGK